MKIKNKASASKSITSETSHPAHHAGTPSHTASSDASSSIDMAAGAASFERLRPAIEGVRTVDLAALNVDVNAASFIALSTVESIQPLMPTLLALPGIRTEYVRDLADYARAAQYTNAIYLVGERANTALQSSVDEGVALRADLFAAADVLVHFKLFDGPQLNALRAGSGFLDLSADLTALGSIFRENWLQFAGKTPVTRAQVDRAEPLGLTIGRLVAQRDLHTPTIQAKDPASLRPYAWTLLVQAYDEVQAAVRFVRRNEGDAESIARTLYQHTTVSRRTSANGSDTTATPSVTTPSPVPVTSAPAPVANHVAAIPPAKDGGPFTS